MKDVLPNDAGWAFVFTAMALLQVWRLYARSTKQSVPWEFGIKLAASFLWTFVAVACLAAQWPLAAAMSDTFVVSVACWWDFLRYEGYRDV